MLEKGSQSPTNDDFVQNPYPFYKACLAKGGKVFWSDYNMISLFKHGDVSKILKDRRFGREYPEGKKLKHRKELAAFYELENHSMLQLEPKTLDSFWGSRFSLKTISPTVLYEEIHLLISSNCCRA